MFQMVCPHCGPRDEAEFDYRGDATVDRPGPDGGVDAFYEFVYARDNPKGWHVEWWQHLGGCRQWLKVVRHTVTHEIAGVHAAGEPVEVPAR